MGILLALLGIGLAAAAAGTAKAQAPTPAQAARPARRRAARPSPKRRAARKKARKAERSRLAVAKPPAKVRRARAAKIARAMTPRERAVISKVKRADVNVATQKGRDIFGKLLALAAAKKTQNPIVRRAAQKKVAEIARTKKVKALPAQTKAKIAETIVARDTQTEPTPAQAAQLLQVYTKNGGWQGTKNARSVMVANSQRLMGFSPADSDGIIGPKTRERARALGFPLYARSQQAPGAMQKAKLL